jgi:hypothetical protein
MAGNARRIQSLLILFLSLKPVVGAMVPLTLSFGIWK